MTRTNDHRPLSLAHLSALDVAPGALVELAADAGFASIGLRVMPAAPGAICYPLASDAERADMRRRLAARGVDVMYVELVSLARGTRIADCRALIETGAAIGATRIAAGGDDADLAVVAERMAELCDLARPYGMAVDLEFMPFRPVRSIRDAAEVVRRAGRPNAHILLDTLHFYRSGSTLADLAAVPSGMLGTVQLCDAPAVAPAPDQLVVEARTNRLLPGTGGLALRPLLAALPSDLPLGVELPIAGQHPALDAGTRLKLMVDATRAYLAAGAGKEGA